MQNARLGLIVEGVTEEVIKPNLLNN